MPRIPNTEIDRIKRSTDLAALVRSRGIELKKHGTGNLIGLCPFHDDKKTPNLVITPGKGLFHCLSCGAAGSVIDLVMKIDGVTFREAVSILSGGSTGKIPSVSKLAGQKSAATKKNNDSDNEPPAISPEHTARLLERTVTLYERSFADEIYGAEYLAIRGIDDKEQLGAHRAGYSNGGLCKILPKTGTLLDELKTLGVLNRNGREHFAGCVVFPILDIEGNIVTLYGRVATKQNEAGGNTVCGAKRHVFLPGRHKGLWNASVIKTYPEIIVVESVIDGLSVEAAGYPNVVAINGSGGMSDGDIEDLHAHGVQVLVFMLDGDKAGASAAEKIERQLKKHPALERGASPIATEYKVLPEKHDPSSFMLAFGRKKLAELIEVKRGVLPADCAVRGSTESPACKSADEYQQTAPGGVATEQPGQLELEPDGSFTVAFGIRSYRLMGLEKNPRRLKITVRVEHAGRLHVDTLDLYSSRSRKILAGDLCRLFEETAETIDADIGKLIKRCESMRLKEKSAVHTKTAVAMTARDKSAAEAFGRRGDLIAAILSDFDKCGLVGEKHNKLLAYLAAVSRKMDAPLSLLVLSSSGAGKTALQDSALAFMPPEDLVKLTSLSGKALFYKERHALKHKVLALEEGDGAEAASYAIRNLISAGELVIESTIKDLGTGRLTTMENRVEGPTSVFITTTNPETDPETKSRFFVTSIDEGREQTRAILSFQRKRQTLDGLVGNLSADIILKLHRNFQRLLKPLAVVNPFADRLAYGDDRLQSRRDQPKYLNLIKAVAFLRQMQKEVSHAKRNGETVPYVLVDVEDMHIANKLAHEILGRSLDELSSPGRALLLLLDEMVEQLVKRQKKNDNEEHAPGRRTVSFTRREIRESTGWAHTRVHRYLKELVELEYVLVDSGRNGTLCYYRLAYEGQGKNGERFMLGLTDPDSLERKEHQE